LGNNAMQIPQLMSAGNAGVERNGSVYLASDEHYLAGQVISPNGGMVM
jgi:hypothetical protein